ncbi:MAG: ribosome biogenesis GTP-binding protein YihA/YsxC [Lachnospiraceae bacterium]|nr:ribosome biogenesis GTP-binding protein YihA/YsxC [Lachnospiraceae bacterium]
MVIKTVDLETVVGVTTKKLPINGQPEVAFAGRSNVGKSSLINAIMNRKSFARVSETPGKTQTINYYHINREFYLVDLPGYGYAKVSLDFKAAWGPMIERYLHKSRDLRAVFQLIDIRRTPNQDDLLMYDWICSAGFQPIIIVTKTDKLKRSQREAAIEGIRQALPGAGDTLFLPFSAKDKSGKEEICEKIDQILSS